MDTRTGLWTPEAPDGPGVAWVSARDAAAVLGLSQRAVWRAIARGDLVAAKRAGVYRISPADLAAYARAKGLPARPAVPSQVGLHLVPFPQRDVAALSLPSPRTPLIGREAEVASLVALLGGGASPLVTLQGPGGVGKTRLAIQVAKEVAPDFPDGVRFVPLAAVSEPALVGGTLLHAFGLVEQPNRTPREVIAEFIGTKRLLLVLDNFEHLLGAAPLVADLLASCPRLLVLVTSRARLNLSGESQVPVPPLPVPDRAAPAPTLTEIEHYAAVRLFVARAQTVDPAFRLTEQNAGAVSSVCAAVDGLPLAIELAAAQTRLFSPQALERRMGRRLAYLAGGPQDLPPRHRTMRDAIAWSYDLLTADEQADFRRLAVFSGSFSLEAAGAVAGAGGDDIVTAVAALTDHHLLGRVIGPDDEPRLGMLETIREFALERLVESGEEDAVRRRHAAHVLDVAERAEPALLGPDQVVWLDVLDADLPSIQSVLLWLLRTGDSSDGLRIAAALWTFWVVRGRVPEGRRWLESFLASDESGAAVRAKALVALGDLAERQGDYDTAAARLEEARELAEANGDRQGEAAALRVLGNVALSLGEAAHRRQKDPSQAAREFARAEDLLRRSLAIAEEIGDRWGAAKATHYLALIPQEREDFATAISVFQQAIQEFRALGDHRQVCMVAGNIGGVAVAIGDLDLVRSAVAESLSLAVRLDYRWWIGACLNELGHVAAQTGESVRAARLLGAAAALRAAAGAPLRAGPQSAYETTVGAIAAVLGEPETAAALRHGAEMPLAEVLGEAEAVCAGVSAGGGRGRDRAAAGLGLTPRERDVLRLMADGMTDREIADALFVGVRTVRSHVASILAKLGVPTRTAAAAYAIRLGLI